MSNKTATANSTELVKSYQFIDNDGVVVNEFNYQVGKPLQYRFNGQSGLFNRTPYLYETDNVVDNRCMIGSKLVIQPIGYRTFNDSLFARKSSTNENELKFEEWAEVFFVNDRGFVSSIMFNGTSLRDFSELLGQLFYADKTLEETQLTITCIKKEKGDKKWFSAVFVASEADVKLVEKYKDFSMDFPVFQADTVQKTAVIREASDYYPLHLFGLVKDFATGMILPVAQEVKLITE
jgi:hypothetical protein